MLPIDCLDLMDSHGHVMNLEEKQHSMALASSVLAERRLYVLLRVCGESVSSINQRSFKGTTAHISEAFSKQNHVNNAWAK